MTIGQVSPSGDGRPLKSEMLAEKPPSPAGQKDSVTIGETKNEYLPKIIIGARTADLSPLMQPKYYTTPVAIEIANGIGFGLDGESIIVSGDGREGTIEIRADTGEGEPAVRDFKIERRGPTTKIDACLTGRTIPSPAEAIKSTLRAWNPSIHSMWRSRETELS